MDLHVKKLQVIEEILSVTNENLIDKLDAILKKEKRKQQEQELSTEQYNQELDEADAEIDNGEFLSHEDAIMEIRSWRDK